MQERTRKARLIVCIALGLLLASLSHCVPPSAALKSMSDWSTLFSGEGSIETRVDNDSSEAITVRIQDETEKVIAQAPLPPHGSETVSLPVGPVRVIVRVMRDGRAAYSDPQPFQAAPEHNPAEWHFTAPTVE